MAAGGGFWDWKQAAERRDRAADRRERPTDVGQVGRDEQAALDRELEASDRQAAAEDRDTASRDRAAAAEDRSRSAGDREQAAVERSQHGHAPAPASDWIVGRAHRRMQAVRGRAQETARASAGMVERFIQAKEREVAAHLASIQVHEQMASLQEGLGHLEQAAEPVPRPSRRGSSTGRRCGAGGVSGPDQGR